MPNWLRYPLYVLAAVAVGLVVWLLFRIGWYAMAVILAVLIATAFVGLALIRRNIPELRWVAGVALVGLVLAILFGWIGPSVRERLALSWPFTARSAGERKVDQDHRQGESLAPYALGGRILTSEYCRVKERIDEERLRRELDELLARRRAGTFTAADANSEARAFMRLRDIAEERRLCHEQVAKVARIKDPDLVPPKAAADLAVVGMFPATWPTPMQWFFLIGGVVVLATILSATGWGWAKTLGQGMWRVGVLVAFFAFAFWLIWGTGWATVKTLPDIIRSATASTIPSPPEGATKHTFALRPGERVSLSGVVIPLVHCSLFVEQYPADGRMFFADGGVDDLVPGKKWRERLPVAIEGHGPITFWAYKTGTPWCGSGRS